MSSSSSRLNQIQEGSETFGTTDSSRETISRSHSHNYVSNLLTHRPGMHNSEASSRHTPNDTGSLNGGDGLFSSARQSYGTSPGGHGLGYLMHSRRRDSFREPKDMFSINLETHDESGELPADAAMLDQNHMEQGEASYSAIGNHRALKADRKSFALAQEDSTTPLLLRQHAPGGVGGTAAATTGAANSSQNTQNTIRAVVFGLINATAGIPALVAYAAIVFRHPIYASNVDLLCKFFIVSSALHQTIFCLFSTIPFAVGQVQEVGIIFLAAIGTSIAELSVEAGKDAATTLGTALLTMTVTTFFVGVATMFVARLKLAQYVQYIPLPVMGGYLAFVGYFCISSGIGLGTSVEIGSLASWSGLFHRLPLIKLVPTVASCIVMVFTLEKTDHPLALPSVLIGLVAAFHIVLAVAGISLEEAQQGGWVLPAAVSKRLYSC